MWVLRGVPIAESRGSRWEHEWAPASLGSEIARKGKSVDGGDVMDESVAVLRAGGRARGV